MAGCPRKFSEKIALLNQKQAEGNAAFDSIMCQVKQIKPSGSNQLENLDETLQLIMNLDETVSHADQVSTTYISDQHQQQVSTQFQSGQSRSPKKRNRAIEKHENSSIISNNSFLQLPNQSEFRRAHSDSSIPQSVQTTNSPQNTADPMTMNYSNTNQNYQFQQQNNVHYPNDYQQPRVPMSINNYSPNQQYIQNSSFTDEYTMSLNMPSGSESQTSLIDNKNKATLNDSNSNGATLSSSNEGMNKTKSITSLGHPLSPTLPYKSNESLPLGLNLTHSLNATSMASHSDKNSQSIFNDMFKNNEPLSPNREINYSQNTYQQPSLSSSPTINYNLQNMNYPQMVNNQQYTASFMPQQNIQQTTNQPHQQQSQTEQLLSPNHNFSSSNTNNNHTVNTNDNNFLIANLQNNNTGGSLPDLTSFQFHNNQSHQKTQLQEYSKRNVHEKHNYGFPSSQLLNPNFQQHNHIGPVKPTLDSSVSPTRASARYSPTNIGANSISNRRPSPQHLGLNRQALIAADKSSVQSSPSTPYVSSPNSPLHPSMYSLPSLEFTVNPQLVTNQYVPSQSNGVTKSPNKCRSKTNSKNGSANSIHPNPSCANINPNESLPPSPLSQQSCFNSPQGSPDTSLSPKDANLFTTSHSYDLMHKKFDSINLENNGQQQGYNPSMMPYNLISPTHGSSQSFPLGSPTCGTQSPMFNVQISNQGQHLPLMGLNSPTNGQPSENVAWNTDTLTNKYDTNGDVSSWENHSAIDSRSGSLSSSSSVNNNLIDEEFQNGQNNQQNVLNNSMYQSNNIDTIRQHKNSIPDIIFTFSSDTTDENKGEIKDHYNQGFISKNDYFIDYDLQMLTETVSAELQSNDIDNIMNGQTLYQPT